MTHSDIIIGKVVTSSFKLHQEAPVIPKFLHGISGFLIVATFSEFTIANHHMK